MKAKTIIYSFVVDENPKFAYQAWHLAKSIMLHCESNAKDIHVQFTDEVDQTVVAIFGNAGYSIHRIRRFGDGKWCNKIAQLPNLFEVDYELVVLMDTDMVITHDPRPLSPQAGCSGVPVGYQNPSMKSLTASFEAAGLDLPPIVYTDCSEEMTVLGNFNGGLYVIGRDFVPMLSQSWQYWALWLIQHDSPLQAENKLMHVDQVSFALAVAANNVSCSLLPSNLNFHTHIRAEFKGLRNDYPISILHYHDSSLNVVGLLEPKVEISQSANLAINIANAQISKEFNNVLFWNYRYANFPERGSGVGSRSENAQFKRRLLQEHGIEGAESILDVGSGDAEILIGLKLRNYLGIDVSIASLTRARTNLPDLKFALASDGLAEPAHFVLCFEVLIHQTSQEEYLRLIDFLARMTTETLIVSGYDEREPQHAIYFYESLHKSLADTKKFSRVEKIGTHTDVTIYKCSIGT